MLPEAEGLPGLAGTSLESIISEEALARAGQKKREGEQRIEDEEGEGGGEG